MNTSTSTTSAPAFEPIKPTDGNTYAARMERRDQTAFFVSTDGITVALSAPYVGPVFMNNAEAAAVAHELLKASGKQDHASALLAELLEAEKELAVCLRTAHTEVGRGNARFDGVPEALQERIDAIKAVRAAAAGGAQ